MGYNTSTTIAQHEHATPEAARPPDAPTSSRRRRALVVRGGIVAAVVAVAALGVAVLRGGDDDADFPATRLRLLSEQVDHEAHLEGQQRTYGESTPDDDVREPATDEFVPGSRRMPAG
jgi:hypothetical protein